MSLPDHPESRSTISAACHSAAPLIRRAMAVLAVFLCLVGVSTIAHAETADVQTAWRLLDYMAVDYGGAVSGGRVKSASEYAEMTEFAASVSDRLMALPPTPARGQRITGATQLSSGEQPSELKSQMRTSYDVFCLKKKHLRNQK